MERSFGSHAERSMPGSTSKGDQRRQQSLDYRTRTELRAEGSADPVHEWEPAVSSQGIHYGLSCAGLAAGLGQMKMG